MSQNPYAHLRELTGYGQREFAREFKIARHTVVQCETGQFADLPSKALYSLQDACDRRGIPAGKILLENYGTTTLNQAYHSWQHDTRMSNSDALVAPRDWRMTPSVMSPFHWLIKDSVGSLQGFCKKFCLPPATVTRYASGVAATMPAQIEDVLEEVGYAHMPELISNMQQWRVRQ